MLVCHEGQEICISPNAVNAHLNHGDQIGPCQPSATGAASVGSQVETLSKAAAVAIWPNPARGDLSVRLIGFSPGKAEMSIVDINGALVEKRTVQLPAGNETIRFSMKNKAGGMYILKVVSKDGVHTAKFSVQE